MTAELTMAPRFSSAANVILAASHRGSASERGGARFLRRGLCSLLIVIGKGVDHPALLGLGQAGEDREIQDLEAGSLGFHQAIAIHLQVDKTLLLVHRHGIIDLTSNTSLGQVFLHGVAAIAGNPNRVLIPDMEGVGIDVGQGLIWSSPTRFFSVEQAVVASGDSCSRFHRLIEMAELDSQDRGLESVEPAVDANHADDSSGVASRDRRTGAADRPSPASSVVIMPPSPIPPRFLVG